jgi:nucleoside-diphosphate-sugar epimerase
MMAPRSPGHYLITGAGGFVGSHLLHHLLAEGAEVIALLRPRDGESGARRLAALAPYFEGENWPPSRLRVVEGDTTRSRLGLGEGAWRELARHLQGGQILHCAALVDFSPDRRDDLLATNTEGIRHLLPLAEAAGATFNLMSTAYVGASPPDRSPVREEAVPVTAPPPRNAYEESKRLGEALLLAEGPQRGIPWRILRPSIIVGDHREGRTLNFNTVYTLLQILDAVAQRAATESAPPPLRIRCTAESALNLVPVDYVVAATVALVQSPATVGGIYHLTQSAQSALAGGTLDNARLGEVLERLFPPLRLLPARLDAFEAAPPDTRERLLDRGLRVYRPYLDDHPRFDDTHTRAALAGSGIVPPPVEEGWLRRLLAYARTADWGRRRVPTETRAVAGGRGLPMETRAATGGRGLPMETRAATGGRGLPMETRVGKGGRP